MSLIHLAAKIKARNRANQLANEFQAKLIKDFTPLIGKKVINNDRYMCEKYKKFLPEFLDFQFFQQPSEYSLGFLVRVSESRGEHGCVYDEQHFYVGHLNQGILEKVSEPILRRTDFTVEEIEFARTVCETKREEMRQAESNLCGFGTYD